MLILILHLVVAVAEVLEQPGQLLNIGLCGHILGIGDLEVIEFQLDFVNQQGNGVNVGLGSLGIGFVIWIGSLHFIQRKLDIIRNDLDNSDVGFGGSVFLDLLGQSFDSLRCCANNQFNVVEVLLRHHSLRTG